MSQPQQRANCNNVNVPNVWLGGCFQHYNKTLSGVKIKKNATEMKNWAYPQDPPYIPVAPVLAQACVYLPTCDPCPDLYAPCGDDSSGDTNNYPWCADTWGCTTGLSQSRFKPCGEGTSSWDMGNGYTNCYYQSDETQSRTECHTIGFRNVIAHKNWSGRFGYMSTFNGFPDYWGWCCGACNREDAKPTTIDTTKYLGVSATSHFYGIREEYCTDWYCIGNCGGTPGPDPCRYCLPDCGTFSCDGGDVVNCCYTVAHCGTSEWSADAHSQVHVDHYGNFYVDSCTSSSTVPTVYYSCLGCDEASGSCLGCDTPRPIDQESIDYSRAYWAGAAFGFLNAANGTGLDTLGGINGSGVFQILGWCSMVAAGAGDGCPSVTGDGNSYHYVSYPITYDCYDGCGNITATNTYNRYVGDINLKGGTLHIREYQLRSYRQESRCTSDGYCPPVVLVRDDVIVFTNTGMAVSGISWAECASYQAHGNFYMNAALDTPYTETEVKNECIALLAEWDLGDDKLWNGWRTDTLTTVAPKVSRCEGVSAPYLGSCETIAPYTGEILGKPGPENIDHMWCPWHENLWVCTGGSENIVTCAYPSTYGAWSDQCHVPRATQWTTNYEASNLPPDSAFISYKQFWTIPCDGWDNGCQSCDCNPRCGEPEVTAPPCSWCGDPYYETPGRGLCGCGNKPGASGYGGVWMGKYATIIQNQQSYDFYNRPCGNDRFQPSASAGFCITGSDTGSRTLTLEPLGPACGFSNGDLIWVSHDENDLNGLWKIQSKTPYSITLQDPRYISASTLPNEWMNQFGNGSTKGIVYKLRWQSGSIVAGMKPAICGRIGISDIKRPDTGSVYTASLMEPSYLVNTDIVTIENATGISGINTNWTAAVIDNQHIGLLDSQPLSQSAYGGSGQMFTSPNGGWVSDVSPKGDYSAIQYGYNYRDIGEYARVAYQSASLISGGDPVSGSVNCDNDCDGIYVGCPNPAIGTQPRPWQQYCGLYNYYGYSPNVVGNPCTLQCPGGPDFAYVEISEISCSNHCLPFNACRAGVAYYAPPGQDNFARSGSSVANYKYHGWKDVTIDDQYGTKWIGTFKAQMGEPIHMAPPCYCEYIPDEFNPGYGCPVRWREDDGNCNGYTNTTNPPTDYYPLRNLYEARCTLPAGAPALPDGIRIGCSTITELNAGPPSSTQCGTGNVCPPPFDYAVDLTSGLYDDTGGPAFTPYNQPWITYLAELGCCCLDGRFCGGADNNAYGENGIICFNNGIVNPP